VKKLHVWERAKERNGALRKADPETLKISLKERLFQRTYKTTTLDTKEDFIDALRKLPNRSHALEDAEPCFCIGCEGDVTRRATRRKIRTRPKRNLSVAAEVDAETEVDGKPKFLSRRPTEQDQTEGPGTKTIVGGRWKPMRHH
jgi:hypothetical protein